MRPGLRRGLCRWSAAIALVLGGSGAAQAVPMVVLDFESLSTTAGGQIPVPSPYQEDGYSVTAAELGTWGSSSPHYAGSAGLFAEVDLTLVLTEDGGMPFDLQSIDLALATKNGATATVTFTGTRADASTVVQAFNIDGIHTFQTFTFSGFTNLVSVSWVQTPDYHQIDNIVVVPEPATLPLFAAAALALAACARRPRQRRL